ncbi:MAG: hypothetical protein R3F54_15810 [Alphaproteobacteria bacterium]
MIEREATRFLTPAVTHLPAEDGEDRLGNHTRDEQQQRELLIGGAEQAHFAKLPGWRTSMSVPIQVTGNQRIAVAMEGRLTCQSTGSSSRGKAPARRDALCSGGAMAGVQEEGEADDLRQRQPDQRTGHALIISACDQEDEGDGAGDQIGPEDGASWRESRD